MKRDELKVGEFYAEKHGSSSWTLLRFVGVEKRDGSRPRYERKLPDRLVFELIDDEQRPHGGYGPRLYDSARDIVTWDQYQAWKTATQGKADARAANKARLVAACDALGLTSSETAWHGYGPKPAVLPDAYLSVREEPERCFVQVGIAALERIARLVPTVDDSVNRIVSALADVRHTGDYGIAWWNPVTGAVHLVMGDADGDEDAGLTPFADVEKLLRELPFVQGVLIAAEYGPDLDEETWLNLGSFGKFTVSPQASGPESGP